MSTLHRNSFPIDLDLAHHLFPAMESVAQTIESFPQLYQNLDGFFWNSYASLFTGPEDLAPPDDKFWRAMINLRHTAWPDNNLTADILSRLTFGGERIVMARQMLGALLKD